MSSRTNPLSLEEARETLVAGVRLGDLDRRQLRRAQSWARATLAKIDAVVGAGYSPSPASAIRMARLDRIWFACDRLLEDAEKLQTSLFGDPS